MGNNPTASSAFRTGGGGSPATTLLREGTVSLPDSIQIFSLRTDHSVDDSCPPTGDNPGISTGLLALRQFTAARRFSSLERLV